tara:strand:- start:142 stop:1260 length:1119 start_codon:yes stop_codon:yes gene_type:complete
MIANMKNQKMNEYAHGLEVSLESVTDPRLITPIVTCLFNDMETNKKGSILIIPGDDMETSLQTQWVARGSFNWNHNKWPSLYENSDSAQWWRNICHISNDVRMGYFIIAGVKAGICTLDGRGEGSVWYFSTEKIEIEKKKQHRDTEEMWFQNGLYKTGGKTLDDHLELLEKYKKEKGIEWMKKQSWFKGSSSKYCNTQIWKERTLADILAIPSELEVHSEENRYKEKMEEERKEQEEKENNKRKTKKYKDEFNKVIKMEDWKFYDYLIGCCLEQENEEENYDKDCPSILARNDREKMTYRSKKREQEETEEKQQAETELLRDKERKTEKYRNEINILLRISDSRYKEYLCHHKKPISLAMRDRQKLLWENNV